MTDASRAIERFTAYYRGKTREISISFDDDGTTPYVDLCDEAYEQAVEKACQIFDCTEDDPDLDVVSL